MSLSNFACKAAKPKDKPYRLADGDGLYLLVQKSGSKLWQLRYRYLEKENILSFGKYPLVSLLDAREKRDNAKRLLIGGINPSSKRKEEKIAAITEARTTFGLIAEEYIKRMEERDAAAATPAPPEDRKERPKRDGASLARRNRQRLPAGHCHPTGRDRPYPAPSGRSPATKGHWSRRYRR
jgi:hypothetical protein